jgi:hypothetical protein
VSTPTPEPFEQELSEADSPATSPVYTTTVTNNNRRAELARQKKQETARQKKRQSIGLCQPPVTAEVAERVAYSTIMPHDEAHIAWIIMQSMGEGSDFYSEAKTPYRTASHMLAKARAVGSRETWYNVATFLQSWRERGTPVPSRSAVTTSALSSQRELQRTGLNDCDLVFEQAWYTSHDCERRMASVMIEYRWSMALLGRAYANKIVQIQHSDQPPSNVMSRSRGGQGTVKGQAIDTLLRRISPDFTATDRKAFGKRLVRAKRWYLAAETLGWGILCLMPTDLVSNNWVEKDLRAAEWSLWLTVVKKVNLDACNASIAFDNWVGTEGIQGGPIQSSDTLSIEAEGPTVVYEVEEIADSADEEGDNSAEECTTPSSKSTARPLRQLTLLELFSPQCVV